MAPVLLSNGDENQRRQGIGFLNGHLEHADIHDLADKRFKVLPFLRFVKLEKMLAERLMEKAFICL